MSGYFKLDDKMFADVRVGSMQGRPGLGFGILSVDVRLTLHGRGNEDTLSLADFSADLLLGRQGGALTYTARMWRQGGTESLSASQYPWSPSVVVEVDLDPRRVEAIEAMRLGGNLDMKLWFYGTVTSAAGRSDAVKTELLHQVTQSDWVRVLDQMGYRKTLLLEIPMPAADAPEALRQAVEHLRAAQDLMIHGRYREAVARCRLVCDSIAPSLADEPGLPTEGPGDWFQRQREMTKLQRVRLVRRAIAVLTHPAHHADEVSARHEWGPEDASSIVTATAALLRLATQD